MRLAAINTGFFKLDGGAMFGVVPKTIWHKINPPDENNLCTWAMRCLLVEIDDHLILIDNGIGNKQSEKFFSHYEPHGDDSLEKSLANAGVSSDDITDVVISHLHFDHCGGSIMRDNNDKLVPAFKNAYYWSNEKHWNWATNPNPRERASFLKENILPIQESGQLQFAKDRAELFHGFKVHFVYGHTEAMMIPHIQYKDKTIVFMADLFPSSGHIPLPYIMAYDVRPLITLEERKEILDRAVKEQYILFFEHDPKVECATVKEGERYVILNETFKLKDIR